MVKETDIRLEDLPYSLQEIASKTGVSAVFELINMRGGEWIYIPTKNATLRAARNRMICDEFDGKNYRFLARKYALSMTRIRDIVKLGGK